MLISIHLSLCGTLSRTVNFLWEVTTCLFIICVLPLSTPDMALALKTRISVVQVTNIPPPSATRLVSAKASVSVYLSEFVLNLHSSHLYTAKSFHFSTASHHLNKRFRQGKASLHITLFYHPIRKFILQIKWETGLGNRGSRS